MKRPATSPLAPSSTGEDTSLLSKVLRDLSGASNLKDEGVVHYLATWALSCPLARRQFNNAVQYVNTATSTQTTGEACKATVEGDPIAQGDQLFSTGIELLLRGWGGGIPSPLPNPPPPPGASPPRRILNSF